ncbi:MAG: HIT domain-containing protein [Candidatus Hodarchaeales archaeon]|jgi:UDPglucose--hexose-1-phosphate uridylyltransferase
MNKKTPNEEIPGKWGIYNQSKALPTIRNDPFSTFIDSEGSPIGHKTLISPARYYRPLETELMSSKDIHLEPRSESDTFCKVINGKLPSIVISKDLKISSDPFSTEVLDQRLSEVVVATIINLYPPIARVLLDEILSQNKELNIPTGISYVHVLTKHYQFPEEVPIDEWIVFFENYKKTIEITINHPHFSDPKNIQVHSFFNIGNLAGASIPHLHGQSYITGNSLKIGSRLNSYWKSSQQNSTLCKKCHLWRAENSSHFADSTSYDKRIIYKNSQWVAFLAFAPEKDAHIRIVPKRHISALWKLNNEEITLLGEIFVISNQLLTLFIRKEGKTLQLDLDRNIIFRQFHTKEESHFHMFIDILPFQKLGGAELSDSQKITSVYPELVASKMRKFVEDNSTR